MSKERSERQKRWQGYMSEMCERSAGVDSRHHQEVEAAEKYYKDAEEKLNLNGP